ncbi:MAG TPA: hypothetical protein VM285_15000, partial [Polyangia bacterium]|nr:hypothetical protein [Polyangia bacterium]
RATVKKLGFTPGADPAAATIADSAANGIAADRARGQAPKPKGKPKPEDVFVDRYGQRFTRQQMDDSLARQASGLTTEQMLDRMGAVAAPAEETPPPKKASEAPPPKKKGRRRDARAAVPVFGP